MREARDVLHVCSGQKQALKEAHGDGEAEVKYV